jgi:hypothetical protein
MSFLAPVLLAGLLAIAIPIVVHLVQRERRTTQAFPSLMFLKRIPNQSVRRRAIRHWPLLALRILAFALIALAFARPLLTARGATAAMGGGARHVVVLLDRSASMGYGDRWTRAQDAARRAVRELGPVDGGAVILFAADVEVAARSDAGAGPGALVAAIDRARPGPGLTRIGPALRSAAGLLESVAAPRREVVLVSDYQKSGWDQGQEIKLPAGVALTTISVAAPPAANAAVAGFTLEQQAAPKGVLVTAAARVANYGTEPVGDREVTLEVDGHREGTAKVSVAANSTAAVEFPPFVVGGQSARLTARMAPDALPADDAFHALVTAGGQVPVLILESSNPVPDASLYLARSLDVAAAPGFAARIVRADRVTAEEIAGAAVVVLNDTPPPGGAAGRALASAVRDGAGLLVVLGERSSWTDASLDLLPGTLGAPIDRSGTTGGTLGYLDLSHPAFEIFRSPRSGDLTAARIFRYRALSAPSKVLARFDDGAVALAERKVGRGTVVAWTSTFDSYWNDLPLKPVFVPFVHQLMRHLGHYVEPRPWYSVGDTYDPADAPPTRSGGRRAAEGPFTILSPSGKAVDRSTAPNAHAIPLLETGFYEIRPASGDAPLVVAVNGAAAESDLTPMDPAELKARVSASSTSAAAASGYEISIEERERRQSLWWYLLAAGLLILLIEAAVASRLPRVA